MTIVCSIFFVIWTFRWSSYLLNNLLSLSQKVRLNQFLSRSHEDRSHILYHFLFLSNFSVLKNYLSKLHAVILNRSKSLQPLDAK